MKKALKYTLSALAAAMIAAPAQANPWNFINELTFKAALTYTEASGNTANYAYTGFPQTWRPLFVEPDHEWDYALGLEWRIPGSNTHVFFDFEHFRDDASETAVGAGTFGALPVAGATAFGSLEHREKDFKLGLRHTLEFGPHFDLALGAAIDAAKIERRFNEIGTDPVVGVGTRFTHEETDAIGPFFDVTGRAYPWGQGRYGNCWSLWARAGFGLLYAEHDYTLTTAVPGLVLPSFDPEDTNSIITKVEADFGVEFGRVLRLDFINMSLAARLGVKYINYI
ncbi:MAG TPA: hypothetical protein VFP93_01795, partial [Gammaproteobacteria bacterium]|nr:hypothetical protein [Gammaproteobacteria bacterium]